VRDNSTSEPTLALHFLIFSSVLLRGEGVEKRALKYHRGRLGEALREEIETLVEGELADPRIGLASVTAVHMSDDGRSAQVLVDVDGNDEEAERSLEGLLAAKEYIRHELVERLRLRRAPELYFRLDRSEREKARVEELLARAKKRAKRGKNPGRKDVQAEKK
jgi:ribosome-binding factor A